MGFLAKVAAAGKGRAAIDLFERAYYEHRGLDPSVEPYQFMAGYWDIMFRRAGKDLIASAGLEIAKIYGCLPCPLCVRMIAHHMCCYMIPEFHKTHLVNEWNAGMQQVFALQASGDADRLNALFQAYNPRSYEGFVADYGEPPFQKESLKEYEERLQRLGLGQPPS